MDAGQDGSGIDEVADVACTKGIEKLIAAFAELSEGSGFDTMIAHGFCGQVSSFDVEAQVVNDRTLLPLRAMAEAIGKDVQWVPNGLIVITYPGAGFEPEGKEWMSEVNHDDLMKILNLFN